MVESTLPPGGNLVKCEITGKMCHPDEIIEIQGHRVCAEGKEELLQRLKSGQLMPGELVRPTLMRRFGCIFLDGLILMLIALGVNAVLLGGGAAAGVATGSMSVAKFVVLQAVAALINTVIGLLYFGLTEGTKGQSIGKKAGKIKIVNMDGTPINKGKAFARVFLYMAPNFLMLAFMFMMALAPDAFAGPGEKVVLVLTGLMYVYWLANIALGIADRNGQQVIHDRLTNTRVVMAE